MVAFQVNNGQVAVTCAEIFIGFGYFLLRGGLDSHDAGDVVAVDHWVDSFQEDIRGLEHSPKCKRVIFILYLSEKSGDKLVKDFN